jgi:GcrA cell cycle regulator
MSWDANDVALLKKLWTDGHSAGQIANRLGLSRNAVSAKLKRMGQKRGRKPPTASPKIVSTPKRAQTTQTQATQAQATRVQATRVQATMAACARPVDRVVSPRKPVSKQRASQPTEFTKHQLYAMLADAVRNTGSRGKRSSDRRRG